MSNINYLISKNKRPVWTPGLTALDVLGQSLIEVPLLGSVMAGLPVDICPDEGRVSVPSSMVRKNTYALKVKGHSMVDDNIQDGDVIVRSEERRVGKECRL